MRRILLVDDETNILHALQRALRGITRAEGLEVEAFTDPRLAIQRTGEADFEFVISDYHMPPMNGTDFLRVVKEVQPEMVRMMLSASADFNTIIGAVNEAEVFRYIVKPWNQQELEETIKLALQHRLRLLEEKQLAEDMRAQRDAKSEDGAQHKQDESELTKVKWGPDGSVLFDED